MPTSQDDGASWSLPVEATELVALFDAIETHDPTALIGLPMIATARMLRAAGCTNVIRSFAARSTCHSEITAPITAMINSENTAYSRFTPREASVA